MKEILAPHDNQQGWIYVRVKRLHDRHFFTRVVALVLGVEVRKKVNLYYDDRREESRIISSRRVEEAVETADYLKRCVEEGLIVYLHPAEPEPWCVNVTSSGLTLREAYHRYQAVKP